LKENITRETDKEEMKSIHTLGDLTISW